MRDTNDAVAGPSRPDGEDGSGPDDASIVFLFAVALSAGTGATDVASFVRLGNVFASVMTGNLVLLGLAVERLSATLATNSVIAVVGYVAGVAAGARLVSTGQEPRWRLHRVIPALFVETVLLTGFAVGWELTGARPDGGSKLALLAVASAAMGTQSAAARGLSSRVSTTYLTGTLTTMIAALVTRNRDKRVQWRELWQLLAVAGGAALGGLVTAVASAVLPALPLMAVVAVIVGIMVLERPPAGDRQQKVAPGRQP